MALRIPKQKRSKQLVNDIIEASTIVMDRFHLEKISTNKIAEIAGVSIGSLYQYFNNKNDIFAEVINNRLEENREKIKTILKEDSSENFEEYLKNFINSFIDHLLSQKTYLKALIAMQFDLLKHEAIIDSRWKMSEIIAEDMTSKFGTFENDNILKKKIFYLVNAGFGLVYLYSQVENNPYITPDEMKLQMVENCKNFLSKDEFQMDSGQKIELNPC